MIEAQMNVSKFEEDSQNKPKHIQGMVRKLSLFTRTKHHASTKGV